MGVESGIYIKRTSPERQHLTDSAEHPRLYCMQYSVTKIAGFGLRLAASCGTRAGEACCKTMWTDVDTRQQSTATCEDQLVQNCPNRSKHVCTSRRASVELL